MIFGGEVIKGHGAPTLLFVWRCSCWAHGRRAVRKARPWGGPCGKGPRLLALSTGGSRIRSPVLWEADPLALSQPRS